MQVQMGYQIKQFFYFKVNGSKAVVNNEVTFKKMAKLYDQKGIQIKDNAVMLEVSRQVDNSEQQDVRM
ncbi:hypothetical protein AKO1_015694 [Acrasis kona]|uniref:Uncharacterized protein n=1 Tax=Acrasis kona TaxID=1008807 RepID=A0AAW2ZGP3_9EUKA